MSDRSQIPVGALVRLTEDAAAVFRDIGRQGGRLLVAGDRYVAVVWSDGRAVSWLPVGDIEAITTGSIR